MRSFYEKVRSVYENMRSIYEKSRPIYEKCGRFMILYNSIILKKRERFHSDQLQLTAIQKFRHNKVFSKINE